jgi:hypothetical protein
MTSVRAASKSIFATRRVTRRIPRQLTRIARDCSYGLGEKRKRVLAVREGSGVGTPFAQSAWPAP